jgi:hypothetical protein
MDSGVGSCRLIDEGAVCIVLCRDTGDRLTRTNSRSIDERVRPSIVLDGMA